MVNKKLDAIKCYAFMGAALKRCSDRLNAEYKFRKDPSESQATKALAKNSRKFNCCNYRFYVECVDEESQYSCKYSHLKTMSTGWLGSSPLLYKLGLGCSTYDGVCLKIETILFWIIIGIFVFTIILLIGWGCVRLRKKILDIGLYFLPSGESSSAKKTKRTFFSRVFSPIPSKTRSGKNKDTKDDKDLSLKPDKTSESSLGLRPRLSKIMQPAIKPPIPAETKSMTSGYLSETMLPLTITSLTDHQSLSTASRGTGKFSELMQPEGPGEKMNAEQIKKLKKPSKNNKKSKNSGKDADKKPGKDSGKDSGKISDADSRKGSSATSEGCKVG